MRHKLSGYVGSWCDGVFVRSLIRTCLSIHQYEYNMVGHANNGMQMLYLMREKATFFPRNALWQGFIFLYVDRVVVQNDRHYNV